MSARYSFNQNSKYGPNVDVEAIATIADLWDVVPRNDERSSNELTHGEASG